MLQSTRMTQNDLERGLNQLETLGLLRPRNILLAEYFDALADEGVLDTATSAKISAACNRARYSPVSDEDRHLGDAVDALDRVAASIAAMPAQAREHLVQSFSKRLLSTVIEPLLDRETEALDTAVTPVPPTRINRFDRKKRLQRGTAPADNDVTTQRRSPLFAAWFTRIATVPRVALTFAALACAVAFGVSYFVRPAGHSSRATSEQNPEIADAPLANRKLNSLAATGFSLDPSPLLDAVRSRAAEEMRVGQSGKARLALELVLAYIPDNPYVLNDLAQLYLTSKQNDPADPKRALQLIERALRFSREPALLDTAAEAQFQCGNLPEAAQLEDESMANAFEPDDEYDELRTHRLNQLQKFQSTPEVHTAAVSTADRVSSTSSQNAAPDGGSVRKAEPAAATSPGKPPGKSKNYAPWRLQIPGSRMGVPIS